MARRKTTSRLKSEMNVVPYIDVMLVLLVIFMVTAPLLVAGNIKLPSMGQAGTIPSQPIEIQVAQNGSLSIRLREAGQDFIRTNKEDLLAQVRELHQHNNPIVISGDGRVAYEEVIALMDMLRKAGYTNLGLLVNQKDHANH
ncbi:ExbD/TolR family protein [Basilea psittacipulmonis]|uniref:Biopolymer transporter ExbD n=1 Tax=Basilea psittacipulmonis DSM 24701 TaxID=1072685 RepID=A0A077DHB4_9BURK|nr:ExbD/TolR family protein [Basilea psittacipulmonis]AIL32882.1 biopolymer transporter ExbD [Basilea psittacipulmonis DSM 24701]